MRLVWFTLLLSFAPFLAGAQVCHQDRIETAPGALLFLSSGWHMVVYPSDRQITETWLPMDRLRVCLSGGDSYVVTNLTRKNEHVRTLRRLH